MHHLKDENGTLITDRIEVAKMLGAAIEKSSAGNYSKDRAAKDALSKAQPENF